MWLVFTRLWIRKTDDARGAMVKVKIVVGRVPPELEETIRRTR